MKLSFPSESRQAEDSHITHARMVAERSARWALHHLPELLDSVTIKYDETETPQGKLGKTFGKSKHRAYETRVLHVRIVEELEPLEALEDLGEYAQVFYDILQGAFFCSAALPFTLLVLVHRWLYTDAKILHRNLSPGNIMFRCRHGKVYGVLNDFDLASCLDCERNGPTSNCRTGTRPYMAIDLLNPKGPSDHMYRHDLESLFYVILCLACRYKKPSHCLKDPPFANWFMGTDEGVRAQKSDFILTDEPPVLSSYFSAFSSWLIPMCVMLCVGLLRRSLSSIHRGDFELETLGGEFTYDKVEKAMSTFDGEPLVKRWT